MIYSMLVRRRSLLLILWCGGLFAGRVVEAGEVPTEGMVAVDREASGRWRAVERTPSLQAIRVAHEVLTPPWGRAAGEPAIAVIKRFPEARSTPTAVGQSFYAADLPPSSRNSGGSAQLAGAAVPAGDSSTEGCNAPASEDAELAEVMQTLMRVYDRRESRLLSGTIFDPQAPEDTSSTPQASGDSAPQAAGDSAPQAAGDIERELFMQLLQQARREAMSRGRSSQDPQPEAAQPRQSAGQRAVAGPKPQTWNASQGGAAKPRTSHPAAQTPGYAMPSHAVPHTVPPGHMPGHGLPPIHAFGPPQSTASAFAAAVPPFASVPTLWPGPRSTGRDPVNVLRRAGRELEQLANELEEQQLYDEADQLREQAGILRKSARSRAAEPVPYSPAK